MVKLIPAGSGFARLTEAVTTEYGQLIELVRQAVQAKVRVAGITSDYYVDVRGIWPDQVVVSVRGRLYAYAYTLGADNTVVVGDGQEVVASYQPVAAVDPAAVRESVHQQGSTLLSSHMTVGVLGGLSTQSAQLQHLVQAEAFREATDGSIQVTLLRAGRSINNNFYPDAVLRESAPQFEGVRVFVKSDDEHTSGKGKDVRNLIGGVYGVRFVEGKGADAGALVGTFKPLDPKDAAVVKMTEAVKRGLTGLLGLSIDAIAQTKKRQQGREVLREAAKFLKVHSVDLIVEPGAGGGLDRLTEATATDISPNSPEGSTMPLWKQRLLEAIKAKDPAAHAKIDPATIGDDDLVNLHESVCGSLLAPPGADRVTEAARGDDAPVTRADLAMLQVRQAAAVKITGSKLPQLAKDRLAANFAGMERFTEAQVDDAIKSEGEYLARFTESGSVRVPAFGNIEVGDRSAQIKDMLDAFFDPAHKDHRNIQSFREAYVEITGDRRVTGRIENCDLSRLSESLGIMRESVSSSTFSAALGDSITRRMQALYLGMVDLDTWKKVATWGPVNDFRTQERIRIGGYGNLPAVAQGGTYQPLTTPGDDKATYAVTKRGGTEDVTLEAIKNDDVQALRRIPLELALAAKNTLYEFVFDFYRANPTIYDTKALYHADHGNLFTAALSAAEFVAHRLAMQKQTRAGSGKRLATAPVSILVPFELQETAFNLFVRNQNLDKTFVQSINPEIIPVSYWTDGNDWVTVGDQARAPVLEIGFLDGREDPELFVQDMPNVGSMFTNDKITYKIRHIYGGNILVDGWKATTKAVVA
ncbi:phage major capsid protein [Pseudacidovorax intermedius]|uniref:phage major capsid protein n=1 Tax=Pseudacidovorax intermedius TaxID=433924 RepID=UPI000734E566|nr:hypothetical protein [Pseudacidovorax intermedius]